MSEVKGKTGTRRAGEDGPFGRTRLLVGAEVSEMLWRARIAVFGVGGVGSWCAEALVRSGAGCVTLVDDDVVALSNINRQAPALSDNVGSPKVEEMGRRLRAISPEAEVRALAMRFTPENAADFRLGEYDYVIDAIDSVSCKAALMLDGTSHGSGTRFYSSMGAALKVDPTRVETAEFWKVRGCRLARALRERFKRLGVSPSRKVMCVFSSEQPPSCAASGHPGMPNGSMMPVTATFGMTLAGLVIKDLMRRAEGCGGI